MAADQSPDPLEMDRPVPRARPKVAKVCAGRIDSKTECHWYESDTTELVLPQKYKRRFPCIPEITTALNKFVIYGLHGKTMAESKTIGVKSAADVVESDHLNVRLSIWGDGSMISTSCAWLATRPKDARFRTGTWSTSRGSQKIKTIEFDPPFTGTRTPTVLVWISGFQLKLDKGWELKVSTTGETNERFTMVIETGGSTELYQGLFSWLAFMPHEKKIDSGRAPDISMNTGNQVTLNNERVNAETKTVTFRKTFSSKPEVMMGISGISMRHGGSNAMSFTLHPPEVNAENTELKINASTLSWVSRVDSASVSWVAVAAE